MNQTPEIEGFQLENSVLCKHNKIAGRVQTIVCESQPIRLSDISHLKRLGSLESEGRCLECRQSECRCLWAKTTQAKDNIPDWRENPSGSRTVWRPNSVLSKLSKRGNVCKNRLQMVWVMKPVPKMYFSDSENDISEHRLEEDRKAGGASEREKSHVTQKAKVIAKRSVQSPRAKTSKIVVKNGAQSAKEYFEEYSKLKEQATSKMNTKNNSSAQSSRTQSKHKQPTVLAMKKKSKSLVPIRYDTSSTVQQAKPTKSRKVIMMETMVQPSSARTPRMTYNSTEKHRNCQMNHYAQQVNELIWSQSIFARQHNIPSIEQPLRDPNPRVKHLMNMSDSFSYPSRFGHKREARVPPNNSAVTSFILENQGSGKSRPARTIESLNQMELEAKDRRQQQKTSRYGLARMTRPPTPFKVEPKTLNFSLSQCLRDLHVEEGPPRVKPEKSIGLQRQEPQPEYRIKLIKGERKYFKHAAVQTEASNDSICMLTKNQPAISLKAPTHDDGGVAEQSQSDVAIKVGKIDLVLKYGATVNPFLQAIEKFGTPQDSETVNRDAGNKSVILDVKQLNKAKTEMTQDIVSAKHCFHSQKPAEFTGHERIDGNQSQNTNLGNTSLLAAKFLNDVSPIFQTTTATLATEVVVKTAKNNNDCVDSGSVNCDNTAIFDVFMTTSPNSNSEFNPNQLKHEKSKNNEQNIFQIYKESLPSPKTMRAAICNQKKK